MVSQVGPKITTDCIWVAMMPSYRKSSYYSKSGNRPFLGAQRPYPNI